MDTNSFTFNFLKHQTDICADCDEEDNQTYYDGTFVSYEIKDWRNAWWRVIVKFKPEEGREVPKNSLVGPEGHLEKCNVFTHLVAAAITAFYASIRPLFVTETGTANDTVMFALWMLALCYLSSSVYHVYSPVKAWSAVLRLGDYAGIYTAIASASTADLALTTKGLKNVSWQAHFDMYIAAGIMVVFFVVRRVLLPIEMTRVPYFENKCSLGFARHTNVDLEHSSLRAAGGVVLSFVWVQQVAGAVHTLETRCSFVFVASSVLGTLILFAGMWLDNVLLYPDSFFVNPDEKPRKPLGCACYSKRKGVCGGWIMSSHAFWHIIAFVSTFVTTAGMEYVLWTSKVFD